MKAKKLFIFDTNILLHDHSSIFHFQDNDIVIPMMVIEELDKFKVGNQQINCNARAVIRELDKLATSPIFEDAKGVSLGEGRGNLFIFYHKPFPEAMGGFTEDTPDNRILSVAYHLAEKYPKRHVALISKDLNLRLKAKSIGINTDDYKSDAIKDIRQIHQNTLHVQLEQKDKIDALYQQTSLSAADYPELPEDSNVNYFILESPENSVLAYYNRPNHTLQRVDKTTNFGIKPRNAEQAFAFHGLLNEEKSLISLTGKAGTGKTLLALAAALSQINTYSQILLARPIVSLSNRDLGFLPGGVDDKIGPYMQPLFDNLNFIKSQFSAQSPEFMKIESLLQKEKIQISPLAYIRGRSLSNTYFIVDEAQNLTPHEIKTIITRAGENTKIVFTGDIQQIDSPYLDERSNGIAYLSERMKGQEVFEHINLVHGERSKLAEIASNLL